MTRASLHRLSEATTPESPRPASGRLRRLLRSCPAGLGWVRGGRWTSVVKLVLSAVWRKQQCAVYLCLSGGAHHRPRVHVTIHPSWSPGQRRRPVSALRGAGPQQSPGLSAASAQSGQRYDTGQAAPPPAPPPAPPQTLLTEILMRSPLLRGGNASSRKQNNNKKGRKSRKKSPGPGVAARACDGTLYWHEAAWHGAL